MKFNTSRFHVLAALSCAVSLALLAVAYPSSGQAGTLKDLLGKFTGKTPGANQPAGQPTGQTSGQNGSGGSLKEFVLFDTNVQLPIAKIQLPADWSVSTKTSWNAQADNPVTFYVRAQAPDMKETLSLSTGFFMTYQYINASGMVITSDMTAQMYGNSPMAKILYPNHVVDLNEFMQQTIPTLMQISPSPNGKITDVRVLEAKVYPKQGNVLPEGMITKQSVADGTAVYQLKINGEDFYSLAYFKNYSTLINQDGMGYVAVFGPSGIFGYDIPVSKGPLQNAAQEFIRMVNSYKEDPYWQSLSTQFTTAVQQQRQQARNRQTQQMIDTNKYIAEQRQATIRNRQLSQERVNQGWNDVLTGTSRGVNTATGKELTYSSDFNHTWADQDNRIYQTNGNDNPNQIPALNGGGATWTEVQSR
ncbi:MULTISPECIES: hypothetical protein [Jonquetella]|uniref:hypothetical protein n=1 Tax=Jonquetella TaxID=428711 RepID=UPI0001B90FFB|nr:MULTISPECIES: hypothetical protein [Jonquetella]EEX48754.1 hypothetical protein GCWU000246_00781 [Jonquetella anthropi E3_33 E1]ERL23499.1 hypothetical protein HMPREF1249_0471 [Jonquetella sp. BV3C21]